MLSCWNDQLRSWFYLKLSFIYSTVRSISILIWLTNSVYKLFVVFTEDQKNCGTPWSRGVCWSTLSWRWPVMAVSSSHSDADNMEPEAVGVDDDELVISWKWPRSLSQLLLLQAMPAGGCRSRPSLSSCDETGGAERRRERSWTRNWSEDMHISNCAWLSTSKNRKSVDIKGQLTQSFNVNPTISQYWSVCMLVLKQKSYFYLRKLENKLSQYLLMMLGDAI